MEDKADLGQIRYRPEQPSDRTTLRSLTGPVRRLFGGGGGGEEEGKVAGAEEGGGLKDPSVICHEVEAVPKRIALTSYRSH